MYETIKKDFPKAEVARRFTGLEYKKRSLVQPLAFWRLFCAKEKEVLYLLDQSDEVGLDRFLALVDPSSDLMFYSRLLNANVDLNVYVDRVRAIEAMVGTMQSADW
ncbi:hypothetical protein BpHYR1_033560 [Brachionus plicatilis]|uniref:Uncharacterized protein n=1 Tax=Brachionus plicatilis TaxID=10195 RepID=A0A3M7Q4D1_BRAPC|nr:hypothetical protein BpHYR1_033560 [Brachionus plicatilis]